MKFTGLLLTAFLLCFINLYSQSGRNIWLENVDPKLLERVDASKIPEAPNKKDKGGLRTGRWIIWLSKTHIETSMEENIYLYREANYTRGRITGKFRDYFLSGKLAAEGQMDGNEFNGDIIFYNEDGGKDKIVHYEKGVMNGAWKKYGDRGKISVDGNYSGNIREGEWKGYYDDGKKKFIGRYIADNKNYLWTYWNQAGEITQKVIYFDNEILEPAATGAVIAELVGSDKLEQARGLSQALTGFTEWKYPAGSPEYTGPMFSSALIFLAEKNTAKATKALDELVKYHEKNKLPFEYNYHKSLETLVGIYDEAGHGAKALATLNKMNDALKSGKPWLPFEKNVIVDELAARYITGSDYDKAAAILSEVDLNLWLNSLRRAQPMLFLLEQYYNDNSKRDYKVFYQATFAIDSRITELALKKVKLAEAQNKPRQEIINEIVFLYNAKATVKSLESVLKQYNPKNSFRSVDDAEIQAFVDKYGIQFQQSR